MTPSNCCNNGQLNCDHRVHDINAEENDFQKCVDWIKTRGLEKVCLQFPDDLLPNSARIALKFEVLLDKKVYILGDTTCGSCCVDEVAANHIGADAIVHFGHACLNPTARLPIFYMLPKNQLNIDHFINSFCEFYLNCDDKILLFYDISFAHLIEYIWKVLKPKYPNLILSTLNCTSNVEFTDKKNKNEITISGRCWHLDNGYMIEDYDVFYLGKNNQTLMALAMSIPAKTWHYYDPQESEITKFDVVSSTWLKRRRYLVEKLKDSKTVGIVVATTAIQNYLDALSSIKRILKQQNIKSYIFSVGKPNPAKLANFAEIDVFVMITCPEDNIFDSRQYFKPILTPFEVELAFNKSRQFSTNYCLDFRQILPGGTNYVEFTSSEDTDVSLVSGNIRGHSNHCSSEPDVDKMSALTCKSDGTIAIGKAGANFLNNRSWKGLEQKLGESEVVPAEKGRSGLPVNYDSEPLCNNS
ncbi:2-(3-amino-3-carboxypropyl)histidine synthase subunit 2 [Chelonus insularis]|uniref:2-(3-amino-3-carboxypropyl)histidine synthase subunit 2 n=1 Tax=Chelonus insularis TaxID=460826 RepID=UPI00158C110E|nr:2-(3-amino-3-carboxypropyl)histidine synthase subunit 2 [Chelonus insularis]